MRLPRYRGRLGSVIVPSHGDAARPHDTSRRRLAAAGLRRDPRDTLSEGGPLRPARVATVAIVLVLVGNVAPSRVGSGAPLPGGSGEFVGLGLSIIVASLLAARWLGLDAAALGLSRSRALRGAAIGAALGGTIAAIDVAIVQLAPAIIGGPLVYEPLYAVSATGLARHLAFFLPLGAVIPEEIAFRGTLLGALLRRYKDTVAIGWSAAAFALWHAVVVVFTVGVTSLAPPSPLFLPAILGALLVVFVGGAIMGALRVVTGSLATTVAAHYVFNAIILIGFFTLQPAAGVPR